MNFQVLLAPCFPHLLLFISNKLGSKQYCFKLSMCQLRNLCNHLSELKLAIAAELYPLMPITIELLACTDVTISGDKI
jgi:hypothetical protein